MAPHGSSGSLMLMKTAAAAPGAISIATGAPIDATALPAPHVVFGVVLPAGDFSPSCSWPASEQQRHTTKDLCTVLAVIGAELEQGRDATTRPSSWLYPEWVGLHVRNTGAAACPGLRKDRVNRVVAGYTGRRSRFDTTVSDNSLHLISTTEMVFVLAPA